MRLRAWTYRWLLASYPSSFREQHADCMLATLLDGAAHRGVIGEMRELGGLLAGGLRARGDLARRGGRGKWRHGVAMLLAPLAAVNLAVIVAALWAVQHPPGVSVVHGVGLWWVIATLAAVGLTGAVAANRRGPAIVAAAAGLIPLGYDEWLQATGRGDADHFSIATERGFEGPPMSPFWLFLAVITLVAAVATTGGGTPGRGLRRLSVLAGGAVVVAATLPVSLDVLLALALIGAVAFAVLGAWDRRLHGIGLALWLITLPYVSWWLSTRVGPIDPGWALPAYLLLLPLTTTAAWAVRRRERFVT